MRKPPGVCSPPRLQISSKLTLHWTILFAMMRAVEIVRAVSAMFQGGEMTMLPVDVRQLLLGVARVVSADAITKPISWSMELPDSMPFVRGNQTHLTEAVLNLVMNAFDSVCDEDGPREVTLSARQNEPAAIRISVTRLGQGHRP